MQYRQKNSAIAEWLRRTIMTALEYVKERKIVAIVRGLKPEYMVRLAHAFEEGGNASGRVQR